MKSLFTSAMRPPKALHDSGTIRDHDLSDTQLSRQETAKHGPGAAERHQGEIARVDAKAGDELVGLDEHFGDGDLKDGFRGASQIHSQFRGLASHGGLGSGKVDGDGAVGQR